MTDRPAVDRVPIAHSVRYAARGLPEVPNQYGPGVLAPSEITLTYRAAPDSQLGRVHAYVAGRIWVDGAEIPLLPGGLYGQHYDDGLDGWPAWLAEEARLHDPEPAGCVPAADQAAEEHRRELSEALGLGTGAPWDAIHDRATELGLPPLDQDPVARRLGLVAAYRAAVLREAADGFDRHGEQLLAGVGDKAVFVAKALRDQAAVWSEAAETLRRMAAETPQPTQSAVHIGGNAEDCPACSGTNPPYPFICPGPAVPAQPGKEEA
jgi:hypothetical protein